MFKLLETSGKNQTKIKCNIKIIVLITVLKLCYNFYIYILKLKIFIIQTYGISTLFFF